MQCCAFQLVRALSSNNISQSAKFLSPRIAPMFKQEAKGVEQLLSPSLFSLYRDDSPNNIASMPEILGAAGLSDKDQDTMLELMMEMSGARAIVDKLFDNIDNPKGKNQCSTSSHRKTAKPQINWIIQSNSVAHWFLFLIGSFSFIQFYPVSSAVWRFAVGRCLTLVRIKKHSVFLKRNGVIQSVHFIDSTLCFAAIFEQRYQFY
jgi:hypothetical protein